MSAAVQNPPSSDNLGANADRPEMPHRNSSTQHVPPADAPDSKSPENSRPPVSPVERKETVARASHRGAGHAESKPYNADAPHAGSRETHDGSVPEKVDVDGPPQPDWDKAEKEREERREAQKKAEEQGSGGKDYPEQIHAGHVGVGPDIARRNHASFTEKVAGFKQVVVGKVTRKPETAQHGHDMMTGALKRAEQEKQDEELARKFDKPGDKPQEESQDTSEKSGDKPEESHDKPEESGDKSRQTGTEQ